MSISEYRFRPSLFASLLALAGFSLFAALALWQVDRATEKQALQATVQQRLEMAPRSLSRLQVDTGDLRFMRVEGKGVFEKGRDILLDNIVYQGTAGYYLYSVLQIEGRDERVLVNRGWLPMGRSRNEMPAFTTPQESVLIHGVIARPRSKPVVMGNIDRPNPEHEQVWLYLDLDYLANRLGQPLMPFVVRMDAADPWGYTRDWPRFDAKVSMHVGYAIQWAVFAIIVLVVYLGLNLKKSNRSKSIEHDV